MYRSFTDRVLGGVCGGFARVLPVNAWWFRGTFAVLSVISLGAFAALYLLLWWVLPRESLTQPERGGVGWLFVTVLLTAATAAGWIGRSMGLWQGAGGQDLFWPAMLLALSAVFFLRQIGGRA